MAATGGVQRSLVAPAASHLWHCLVRRIGWMITTLAMTPAMHRGRGVVLLDVVVGPIGRNPEGKGVYRQSQ